MVSERRSGHVAIDSSDATAVACSQSPVQKLRSGRRLFRRRRPESGRSAQCGCCRYSSRPGRMRGFPRPKLQHLPRLIVQDSVIRARILAASRPSSMWERIRRDRHPFRPRLNRTAHSCTWLANFSERIANFVDAFGTENVKVIDYDHEMKTQRNVIPSFIRALDLEEALQTTSCSSFFLNASHSADACSIQT